MAVWGLCWGHLPNRRRRKQINRSTIMVLWRGDFSVFIVSSWLSIDGESVTTVLQRPFPPRPCRWQSRITPFSDHGQASQFKVPTTVIALDNLISNYDYNTSTYEVTMNERTAKSSLANGSEEQGQENSDFGSFFDCFALLFFMWNLLVFDPVSVDRYWVMSNSYVVELFFLRPRQQDRMEKAEKHP